MNWSHICLEPVFMVHVCNVSTVLGKGCFAASLHCFWFLKPFHPLLCNHLIVLWRNGCNVDIPLKLQRFLFVACLNNLGSQYYLPSTLKRNSSVSHWKLIYYKDRNLRSSVLLSLFNNMVVAAFLLMAQAMTTFCPYMVPEVEFQLREKSLYPSWSS